MPLQELPLRLAQHLSPGPEAILKEGVGVRPQAVEEPQQHFLLGEADIRLIIAHGGLGDPQKGRQRRLGQSLGLPLLLDPFSETHTHLLRHPVFVPLHDKGRFWSCQRKLTRNLLISS